MKDIKISVIVPVYNVKSYLKRCMESLLNQSFEGYEIILVDDGSTDGGDILCDEYAHLAGVQVLHQENKGLGMARNRGLEAACGAYVAFVDADDYLGPDSLNRLYEGTDGGQVDFCMGGFTICYPSGRQRQSLCTQENRALSPHEIRALALDIAGSLPSNPQDSRYGMNVWGRLYRRSLLESFRIRFVSERELISEDLIFHLDFLPHIQKAVLIADTSYFYCTNAGSLSKRHKEDRFFMDCRLYTAAAKRLDGIYEEKEYRPYLQRLLLRRARIAMVQEVIYHDEVDRHYPLRHKIRNILANCTLQTVLKGYPWQQLPWMQGQFVRMMKNGNITALILSIRLKQYVLPGNQIMKRREPWKNP